MNTLLWCHHLVTVKVGCHLDHFPHSGPTTCSLVHLTYWPSLSTENMWLKLFSFLIFYITAMVHGTAMSTLPYSYLLFLAFMIPVTAWLVNQNRKLFNSPYGSIYLKHLNSKTLYICPPDFFLVINFNKHTNWVF